MLDHMYKVVQEKNTGNEPTNERNRVISDSVQHYGGHR